jgi:hypothetical protein
MKIRPLGAELIYAKREADILTGGQRDITKVIVAFSTFANTPETLRSSKRDVASFVLHFLILSF